MEQNLSERERQQRLAMGILSASVALALYLLEYDPAITVFLALMSLGFILNYFTCFCGTKKAIKSIRERLKSW